MIKGKIDFCPVCRRNMVAGEQSFDLEYDNHVDRCVNASRTPQASKDAIRKIVNDWHFEELKKRKVY